MIYLLSLCAVLQSPTPHQQTFFSRKLILSYEFIYLFIYFYFFIFFFLYIQIFQDGGLKVQFL